MNFLICFHRSNSFVPFCDEHEEEEEEEKERARNKKFRTSRFRKYAPINNNNNNNNSNEGRNRYTKLAAKKKTQVGAAVVGMEGRRRNSKKIECHI